MNLDEITENHIRRIADSEAVRGRGLAYYRGNRVRSFAVRQNKIIARVSGTHLYETIVFADNGGIQFQCSCPFEGSGCKHVVAVLYKWLAEKNNQPQNSSGRVFSAHASLEELVRKNPQEKLLNAIQFVKNGSVTVAVEQARRLSGFVLENNQRLSVEINRDQFFGTLTNCACGEHRFSKCIHSLALELAVLNKKDAHSIRVFENQLLEGINREKLVGLHQALSEPGTVSNPPIHSARHLLFCRLKKKNSHLFVALEKAAMLKNGSIGASTSVTPRFLKTQYGSLPEKKQKTIDWLFSRLHETDSQRFSLYENQGIPDFLLENDAGAELLERLQEASMEDPFFAANAVFIEQRAEAVLAFEPHPDSGQKTVFLAQARLNEKTWKLDSSIPVLAGRETVWFAAPNNSNGPGSVPGKDFEIVRVPSKNPEKTAKLVFFSGTVFEKKQLHRFLEEHLPKLATLGETRLPKTVRFRELNGIEPVPRLFLKDSSNGIAMDLCFRYGESEAVFGNHSDIFCREKKGFVRVKRNLEKEEAFSKRLAETGVETDGNRFVAENPFDWLADKAPVLLESGFEFFGHESLARPMHIAKPSLTVRVSSGIDWFDIEAEAGFGSEKIAFSELAKTIGRGERIVRLSDGSFGAIPKKWLEKMQGTAGFLEKIENKKMRACRGQLEIVQALVETADSGTVDQKFGEFREKFRQFRKIKTVPLPKQFNGSLRDYQKAGYYWMNFLQEFGFGGCLADEMGLGKTIQVLALLQAEKEKGNSIPSLVVVPTSLVFNWVAEAQKFTPGLKTHVHHGLQRAKKNLVKSANGADIILTTYGTLRNDTGLFEKNRFHYVILDESQNIKNPLSKNAQSTKALKADYRLVLTGTPIENNSFELWSQFRFLNPGLLGTKEYFQQTFSKSIEQEKDQAKTIALKNLVNPFLLRRKKETVAKELPPKQITTLYCEMDEKQREIYEHWKQKTRNKIQQAIAEKSFEQSKIIIIQGLTRLRQICNHPSLVDESYTGSSGKFELLAKQIQEVIDEGHKALVFSSFVKMLEILKKRFSEKKIPFAYLDGKTKNREQIITEFQQNDSIQLFLISLKAGGLGLNLTAADYVFIVDPWWNPAAEMQAIDRTHRIGQQKNIFVYKTVTKESVEEKILELQEKKLELVQNLVGAEQGIFKKLTREQITSLFA